MGNQIILVVNSFHQSIFQQSQFIMKYMFSKLPLWSFFCFFSVLVFCYKTTDLKAMESAENSWNQFETELSKILDKENISMNEKCLKSWNIIWPLAKKNNLEARAFILGMMYGYNLNLPGRYGDDITRNRDIIILAIHSQGSKYYQNFSDRWINNIDKYNGADEFKKCLKLSSENCSQILVEKRSIPSFNEFSKEVDLFYNHNFKPTCEKE